MAVSTSLVANVFSSHRVDNLAQLVLVDRAGRISVKIVELHAQAEQLRGRETRLNPLEPLCERLVGPHLYDLCGLLFRRREVERRDGLSEVGGHVEKADLAVCSGTRCNSGGNARSIRRERALDPEGARDKELESGTVTPELLR